MKTILSENGKIVIGHVCKCGKTHEWPAYVFAHYHDELKFTCPHCQEQVIIYEGEVNTIE